MTVGKSGSAVGGALTGKQRMVIDYMRGNGGLLTDEGYSHLIRRGSFRSSRSLAAVLSALAAKGLVKGGCPHGDHYLTREGRRA